MLQSKALVLLAISNLCRAIAAAQFQDHGVLLRLQNSQLHTGLHAQLAAVLIKLSKLSSVVRLTHVDRNDLAFSCNT